MEGLTKLGCDWFQRIYHSVKTNESEWTRENVSLKKPESCTFPQACLAKPRKSGRARETPGRGSEPLKMSAEPRKGDRSKRNRTNIRRLGTAFYTFHSLEPRGTPVHAFDLLLFCKRPGPRRTPERRHCSMPAAQKRRRPSETRVNIRSLCTKHSPTLPKNGRARGMKRLPFKKCGARGTPRRAATPWESAVSQGCHVKQRSQWMSWVSQTASETVGERMERKERIQN